MIASSLGVLAGADGTLPYYKVRDKNRQSDFKSHSLSNSINF